MKRLALLLIAASLTFISCKKDNTPTQQNDTFEPSNEDTLIATGSFINEVHPTSGTINIYKNNSEYILQIQNLQSDNGPDLRVYISADKGIGNSLSLGALKATNGNFQYTFPLTSDLSDKEQVLIWCEDFSVLFGSAAF